VRVLRIIWLHQFVDKLDEKHGMTTDEVEDILYGKLKVRRIAAGDVEGEHLYLALGQTSAGRYLAIFFILKHNSDALPISARDMDNKGNYSGISSAVGARGGAGQTCAQKVKLAPPHLVPLR
jgi:uncharacterized DUF497 family protein